MTSYEWTNEVLQRESWDDEVSDNPKRSLHEVHVAGGTNNYDQYRNHNTNTMENVDLEVVDKVQQHDNHDEADREGGTKRTDWLRNVLIFFVILAFLTLFFPFYIIWRDADALASSLDDDDNQDQSTNAIKLLESPPSNLKQICSKDSIETNDGRKQCEEACSVADCCEFPTNLDLSCIFGNEYKCLQYHEHCNKLGHASSPLPDSATTTQELSIPRAPYFLPEFCSQSSLKLTDGYSLCEEACTPGKCCYEKQQNSCTSQKNCKEYSPCVALAALDHMDTGIVQEVNDKCSPNNLHTSSGRDDCLDICAHSLCCFADDITGACPDDDDGEFCKQYQSCGNLFNVTKKEIDAFCDPLVGDQGTCVHFCYPGRCCFDQGECFDGVTKNDCAKFESCGIVLTTNTNQQGNDDTQNNPVNNPANNDRASEINEICSPNNIQDVNGKNKCLDACADSLCCFAEDIVGPCPGTATTIEQDQFCAQHEGCKSVFDIREEQVAQFCDPYTGKYDVCQNLCTQAQCCFGQGACYNDVTTDDCDLYQPCSIVFSSDLSQTNDTFGIESSVSDVNMETSQGTPPTTETTGQTIFQSSTYSKEQVDDACLNHNNNGAISGHVTLCQELCDTGSCCFNDSGCTSSPIDCGVYQACPGYTASINTEKINIQQQLDIYCNDEEYKKDRTECVELCAKGACCFTFDPKRSCLETGVDILCSDYQKCEKVFN